MEAQGSPTPIGRTGTLQAVPLTNVDGNHALLLRSAGEPRALVTGHAPDGEHERLVVTPLGGDVDVRRDDDALAGWLAQGSLSHEHAATAVPGWASAIGLVLLLAVLAFAILGSLTFFGWLLG